LSRVDEKFKTQFAELGAKKYEDQAKWFMNGFWNLIQPDAEKIWGFAQKFISIDPKGKTGNELNEFEAHKFIESLGEPLTVVALRERLRQIDIDNNNKMSLIEYLIFKYKKTVQEVVTAPQGDNADLGKAQKMVEDAQAALKQMEEKLEASKKADEENAIALKELQRQEEEYHGKIKTLETKSTDTSASQVQRNKAANELSQLKGEDPLPLRKAKITQEATVRKSTKALKEAEDATARAYESLKSAEEFLQKCSQGGESKGSIWYMKRELLEAQKYLPKNKQQNIQL